MTEHKYLTSEEIFLFLPMRRKCASKCYQYQDSRIISAERRRLINIETYIRRKFA